MREEKYGPLTVVVVDDDELDRRYLTTLLDEIGIGNVLAAENGDAALKLLTETDADVDFVICDVDMPEMNGFGLVRRIRYGLVPRFKDVPVLLITERATEGHTEHARTHKVSGLLEKPLIADVLKVQLFKVLGV